MRGKLNGIWLTERKSLLHPAIIPNLSSWIEEASICDFAVVLWTNTNELAPEEIKTLEANHILIQDHSACQLSLLYPYFLFFLEKGIEGDKAAFALASDILRMAILELTPEEEVFIYADPNDIKFLNLKEAIIDVEQDFRMLNNPWGFSFSAEPLYGKFHIRNDVLIALKKINPDFFNDYLKAYAKHLEENVKHYFTPTTDDEAQALARRITLQTSNYFLKIWMPQATQEAHFKTLFGDYKASLFSINAALFLPHVRIKENSNTWLPTGQALKENAEIEKLKQEYNRKKKLSSEVLTNKKKEKSPLGILHHGFLNNEQPTKSTPDPTDSFDFYKPLNFKF